MTAERILVLAPTGRDAVLACEAFAAHGLTAWATSGMEELVREVGAGAAALVLTEESLDDRHQALADLLARQPPWSDLPVIVLGDPEAVAQRAKRLLQEANVTVLERPFRVRTLVAAARAAVRARRRQYEAQRAIRNRDHFLAMLGHELRNPLAAVAFALQGLQAQPDQGTRAMQLAVVERQARRLGRLVDDLLDVARVTSGKVQVRKEPMGLLACAQRTVEAQGGAAAAAGVKLTVGGSEAMVEADPVRLEQVLTNLVANAIKFTPQGGLVEVLVEPAGQDVEVRVRDTGVGIPPEALGRVFDLFAQVEHSIDRSKGGLGLGLTLARSLVELHGGTIAAASPGPGRGAEFTVHLPAAPSVQLRPEPARGPPKARSCRVVLVEDNEDIRNTFRWVLESGGHEVHEAGDGPTGIDAIVRSRPTVAFVDVGLPLVDGYEVARRVRPQVGPGVTLVAMTGYGQPEDRERAREAGFDLHLTKPVDLASLAGVLQQAQQRGHGLAARPTAHP